MFHGCYVVCRVIVRNQEGPCIVLLWNYQKTAILHRGKDCLLGSSSIMVIHMEPFPKGPSTHLSYCMTTIPNPST